jgi:hypothetical protein
MDNRVTLTCIMSTIPHEHVPRVFTSIRIASSWRVWHFQNNELSKPQIWEISKGVREPILKFPHQASIRTKKFGNSFISLPFLQNGHLEIPVDVASCRKSRRPCSIDPFPASYMEALDVEILLSGQGSRIVNVKKSSIVYSFLVRAQGSTPRIDQSFLLRFFLLLSQT